MAAAVPVNPRMLDVITLSSPNQQRDGVFGMAVAGAGDVNEDGFDDVIVAAKQEEDFTGRVYVFSGLTGAPLLQLTPPHPRNFGQLGVAVVGGNDVNRDSVADIVVGSNHERAYVFSGRDGSVVLELVPPNPEQEGLFGEAVSGGSDINQDGHADVLVGASLGGPLNAGRAYVFSGRDAALLFELVSPNQEELGVFGASVAFVGDVNEDGFVDTLVGAYQEDTDTGLQNAGRAYVFSGQDGALLMQLVSPNEEEFGHFGSFVAGIGDVNRGGSADLIVGAPSENSSEGRAYVFSGEDGHVLFEVASPNQDEMGGGFGTCVAGAGDVSGDGVPDFVVSAPGESPGNSPPGAGRAYAFSGKDGGLLFELASPNEQASSSFGTSVSAAGDVNRDGLSDVIAGAHGEHPASHDPPGAGRAYVFLSAGAAGRDSRGGRP
jgi:hypothetical protein